MEHFIIVCLGLLLAVGVMVGKVSANSPMDGVVTFTPTATGPTATPTEALAGGPQQVPTPTPWTANVRLYLPVISQ